MTSLILLVSFASTTLIAPTVALSSNTTISTMCYDCTKVPYQRDCDYITLCAPDTKCFTELVATDSGQTLYNSGCMSDQRCKQHRRSMDDSADMYDDKGDLVMCVECCDGDYCNVQGCGSPILPSLQTRGPICFNCHQQKGKDSCFSVTVCGAHEMCSIKTTVSGFGDILYSTGCSSIKECSQLQGTLASGSHNTCSECCNGDYCNRNCTKTNTGSYHMTTTTVHIPPYTNGNKQSTTQETTTNTNQHTHHLTLEQKCRHRAGYNYDHVDRLCFRVYQALELDWYHARDRCRQDGGDLFVLPSYSDGEYWITHVHLSLGYWVGATRDTHARWTWLDGHQVDQSYFFDNQPNGRLPDQCGMADKRKQHPWSASCDTRLEDRWCMEQHHFICQLK